MGSFLNIDLNPIVENSVFHVYRANIHAYTGKWYTQKKYILIKAYFLAYCSAK